MVAMFACSLAQGAPRVAWQSKFGGNGHDRVTAAATDREGNLLLLGETTSRDFPATTLQTRPGGSSLLLDGKPVDIPLSGDVRKILTDRSNLSTTHVLTGSGLLKTADSAITWQVIYKGIIDDFAVNPRNSNNVYIIVSGKVLKTMDGGITWNATAAAAPSPVSTVFFFNFTQSLQIDPYHPETIYWNGLYRSVDGGAAWMVLQAYLGKLIFDPLREGVVFRYELGGLEKSIDGGASWTQIDPTSPNWSGATSFLLPDPNRPGFLYAIKSLACQGTPGALEPTLNRPGLYNPPCTDTRLFRSANDGESWTQVGIFGFFFTIGGQPGVAAIYLHDGNKLIRSTDSLKTFTTIAPIARRRVNAFGFTASGGLLIGGNATTDLFAAKLDPQGKMLWSTYLGGDNYEIASGIAAGADGSVYVAGVSYSTSFGITADTGNRAAFVARISADGSKLIYSQPVAQGYTTPAAIAVDRTGAAVIAGRALADFPSTPGAYQHELSINVREGFELIARNAFLMKVSNSGSVIYATYLGDAGTSAVSAAVDDDGNAFACGSAIWKVNSNGSTLLYSLFLNGSYFNALTLDAKRNLYASVGANSGNKLVKLAGDPLSLVYSRAISEDGSPSSESLAVDSRGNAFLAGQTTSAGVITRSVFEGAGRDGGGFLTKVTPDGAGLVYSSYLLSEVTGLTLALDGNPVVLSAPAVVTKFDESDPELSLRLDGVLDAASMESTPLIGRAKIALTGAGLAAMDINIVLNGVPIKPLSADKGRLVFEAPVTAGPAVLHVERSGLRSQDVKLASAESSPTVFSSDGSGKGRALAFNEDGSQNSSMFPASVGSMITFVVNGVNPQNELTILAGGLKCEVVDLWRRAVDGRPGLSDLVTVMLPRDIAGGHHMIQIYDQTSSYARQPRVYIVVE